jgi:hypothetical protein
MIELRAMLRRDRNFEGGFKLKAGTIIYAREVAPNEWIGMYYEDKGTGHGFNLEEEDFGVLENGLEIKEWIVTPDPPDDPEKVEREREFMRRRMQANIILHRGEAERLEELLGKESSS